MSSEKSENSLISENESKPSKSYPFILQILFPVIGGFMFGYDTGVISGAMLLLREYFHLSNFLQEIVVSSAIIAAAISSLIGGLLSDKIGRKITIILSSICFVCGSLVMYFAFNITMLIIGRVIVGIGIGISSSCCPIYIAEVSPENIRGRIIVTYQISITFGMFIASIIDALFYYTGKEGWRFMLGLAVFPAIIELFGMCTVPESFRWLLSKNRTDEAKTIIIQQNHVPEDMVDKYVQDIIEANKIIETQMNMNKEKRFFLCQILTNKVARQSLVVGCGMQMLAQIIGINTIMYYTSSVIRMSGVESISSVLWYSVLVTFFNFFPSFIGYFLIDKIGRRKLATISIICVFLSLITLAITFQIFAKISSPVTWTHPSQSSKNNFCSIKRNCEECVTSSHCGFCYISSKDNRNVILNSSCVSVPYSYANFSSNGWCDGNRTDTNSAAILFYGFCRSAYSWIIILGMIIYLISFTIGMGPIPWAITSEIYPIWCRSANMALSTATNWTFNLIISLTFLSLVEAITKYGTFWLYSFFAICGLAFIYKYLPETNQMTLEEISVLIKDT